MSQAVADLFFSAENQLRFVTAAADLGLTPPMLKHLLTFESGEEQSMRELAGSWQCDASFVTVVVDGLERQGYVERRVAPHDRRIKTVRLTESGLAARDRAIDAAYGPRAGFDALTPTEQTTLARLLTKLAAAQATYDETLVDRPDVRSAVRRGIAQRTREVRHAGPPPGAGWREHLDAHREELRHLRDELARVRAEITAQARRPVDEAKAAKAEVKAAAKAIKADAKAAARRPVDEVTAEVKAATRRRRG
ncbi:MAG TPA: MarR family winged helix-turn-helix transcriptional regulator [Acidimicrobiales bacterium]|nr:MarR family winged helix-turn-helix transcriptional regulator [Acidimicrobiales bacterium]